MHVLIIEDHVIMRQALTDLVNGSFQNARVTQVGGLLALAGALQAGEPTIDLVVLDLILPGECSGPATVARCRSLVPVAPIVAISGLDADAVVPAVFQAGAVAYVPKSEDPQVLRDAMHSALKGERFLPPSLAHLLGNGHGDGSCRMLNERQLKVLELLAQGQPDKTIARQLDISDDTVAYHVKSIFSILDVKTRAQAVGKGHQMGLLGFLR